MSKPIYDEYYKKQDYFGKPYKGFIDFFENYEPKGKVLDLGCGQGRDALALARSGYIVEGVDISKVGIDQMLQTAEEEGLDVKGEVGDIYSYPISNDVDIVLLDSMLHFYKNDLERETMLVKRILSELKTDGIFANFMLKGKKRETQLKTLVQQEQAHKWDILCDDYTHYPESDTEFHMYIVKKLKSIKTPDHK